MTWWTSVFRGGAASLSLLPALLMSPSARAETGPYRFRLTETSVTESGRIVGEPDIKLRTRGYGFTLIAPVGLGLTYTFLTTQGQDDLATLHHDYLDLSYTRAFNSNVLVSLGSGVAIGGDAEIRGESAGKPTGASYFVGPGYAFGWFEVYWICRLNYLRYPLGDSESTAALRHCQLGLGANW